MFKRKTVREGLSALTGNKGQLRIWLATLSFDLLETGELSASSWGLRKDDQSLYFHVMKLSRMNMRK